MGRHGKEVPNPTLRDPDSLVHLGIRDGRVVGAQGQLFVDGTDDKGRDPVRRGLMHDATRGSTSPSARDEMVRWGPGSGEPPDSLLPLYRTQPPLQ